MPEFASAINRLKDLNQQAAVSGLDSEKAQILKEIEGHIKKIAENIVQIHELGRQIKNEQNLRLYGHELKMTSENGPACEEEEALKDEFEQFQTEVNRLKLRIGFVQKGK